MSENKKIKLQAINGKLYYKLDKSHRGTSYLKINKKDEKKGYDSADLIELEQKRIMETESGSFGVFNAKIKSYVYDKNSGEYNSMTQDFFKNCNVAIEDSISFFLR